MGFDISYTYDGAGNRITKNDGTTLTTYTYSNANRLTQANASGAITTYTNDLAGNRKQVNHPDGSIDYFGWDAGGRTAAEVAGGSSTMTYNAAGQRRSRQFCATTNFLYDFKNLLKETDEDLHTQTSYTTTDDEYGDLINEFDDEDTSPAEFYHQFDVQHATNAMLDQLGGVAHQMQYQAFGLPGGTGYTDWTCDPLGGQKMYYLDPLLELYILGMGGDGHNLYDAITGRFTSEDSIRQQSGDINLYRITGNDPINLSDPSGNNLLSDLILANGADNIQHWYPLYLGAAPQEGMVTLSAEQHAAVHAYLESLGLGDKAPDVRKKWASLDVSSQRQVIEGSMRKAGMPEDFIKTYSESVFRGATPGMNNSELRSVAGKTKNAQAIGKLMEKERLGKRSLRRGNAKLCENMNQIIRQQEKKLTCLKKRLQRACENLFR